jgi:hypothetical protein
MINKNQIVEAIQKGVITAQGSYNDAASSPLCWAPEYLTDVHIYQSLFDITDKDSLTLQHNIKDLQDNYSLRTARGRKIKELPDNARIDIILWQPNVGKIRAFIEVKRNPDDFKKDIKRICRLLRKNGEFGVFTSAIHQEYKYKPSDFKSRENTEKGLLDRLQEIKAEIRRLIKTDYKSNDNVELFDENHKIRYLSFEQETGDKKNWVWRPACFLIERK